VFKNALLPITDEEIENYNKYWKLDYIGYVFEADDNEDDITIWRYKDKLMMFSLHRGKVLIDAFQIFLNLWHTKVMVRLENFIFKGGICYDQT